MKGNKNTGNWGEKQAVLYLKEQNYTILETNWRYKKLEIDIIAQRGAVLVFIEVKTRGSNEFGEPETSVTFKKQRFIVAAANQYIIEKDFNLEVRFDVISVLIVNNKPSIKHLTDAFYPTLK